MRFMFMVTLVLVVLISACGGGGNTPQGNKQEQQGMAFPSITEPAALVGKAVSEVSYRRDAADFNSTLIEPHRVGRYEDDWARLTPTWYIENPQTDDMAWVLYTFNIEHNDTPRYISYDYDKYASSKYPFNEFWFGFANLETNRWDWYEAESDEQTLIGDLTAYTSSENEVFVIVVMPCRGTFDLKWLELSGGAPKIHYVTPIHVPQAYTAVQFSTNTTGSDRLLYHWNFGEIGSPSETGLPSPTVNIGAAGVYDVSLTVTNDLGEDTYDFQLYVENDPPGDLTPAWPVNGADSQRSGQGQYYGAQDETIAWTYNSPGFLNGNIVVGADGTAYIVCPDGKLHAVKADGSSKWTHSFRDPYEAYQGYAESAIGPDSTIYVHFWHSDPVSNHIYAFTDLGDSAADKWMVECDKNRNYSFAFGDDGSVYYCSYDTGLYALDPDDGSLKWHYAADGVCQCAPVVGSDGVIYLSDDVPETIGWTSKVIALDDIGSEAEEIWSWSQPEMGIIGMALTGNGALLLSRYISYGSTNGFVTALETNDGSLRWQLDCGSHYYLNPAVNNDGIAYFRAGNKSISAVDTITGLCKGIYSSNYELSDRIIIDALGTLYFIDGIGTGIRPKLVAFNPNNKFAFECIDYDTYVTYNSDPVIGLNGYTLVMTDRLEALGPAVD